MISNEILFKEIFHHANDAILISEDQNGHLKYIEVNEIACKQLRYSREELLQLGPFQITAPEYVDKYSAIKEQIVRKKAIMIQWGYRTKDGRTIPVEINIRSLELDGKLVHIAIARDISHHQELEDQLKKKNAELLNMKRNIYKAMNESNIMVCFSNIQGNLMKIGSKLCDLIGYSEKELLSVHFKDITHPDHIEEDLNMFQQLIERKIETYEMEKRYITKSGSSVWVSLNRSLVVDHKETPLYVMTYIKNIDSQKKLEEEIQDKNKKIQQYQARIKMAEEKAEVIVGIIGLDGIIQEMNDVIYQKLGYTKEEWMEISVFDIIHPADWQQEKKFFHQLRKGKIESYQIEKRIKHKKGSYIWFYTIGSLIRDFNGIPTSMWIHAHEITQRKNLEEQLIKSYREYQKLIDFFPEAIYITKDGKLTYINEKGKKLLGLDNQVRYQGKAFFEFLHPDCTNQFEGIKRVIESNKILPFTQHTIIRIDGVTLHVESATSPIIYHQQESALTISRDVTEAKKIAIELEYVNEKLRMYIEEKDELIAELRKFRHNYLNMIYGMSIYIEEIDAPRLKSHFYSILKELEKLKSNNILSIQKIKDCSIRNLLTRKSVDAQKRNVDLQIYVENDIHYLEKLIDPKDLCEVIANFLDQAIDEVQNEVQKKVVLGLFEEQEYICIFIENLFEHREYLVSDKIKDANKALEKYTHILQNNIIENNKVIRELHIQK